MQPIKRLPNGLLIKIKNVERAFYAGVCFGVGVSQGVVAIAVKLL
ncbi:hypothetical protein [Leptolyngbya sp. BC1307]|nr:hypothetical protein [Leptolyngbya sp. BC1307]